MKITLVLASRDKDSLVPIKGFVEEKEADAFIEKQKQSFSLKSSHYGKIQIEVVGRKKK